MLTIGIIFSGKYYQALSIVAVISFLRNNNNFEKCLYVSDIKQDEFENSIKIFFPNIEVIWIKQKIDYSLYNFPTFKGNYVAYWKLELLDFINKEDTLVYIDSDTYTRREIHIEEISQILKDKKLPFAAVSTTRPVYERWTVLQLKSPFHYINGGFFVYIPYLDNFSSSDILSEISKLMVLDPCSLNWADQDILNYRFRNSTFLLPENYNVTMGMLQTWSHGRTRLNDLYSSSFFQDPIIVHFTGGALLSWPPNRLSVEYRRYLNNIRDFTKEKHLSEVPCLNMLSKELLRPYFSIRNILLVAFGRFYIYQVRLPSLKNVVRFILLKK